MKPGRPDKRLPTIREVAESNGLRAHHVAYVVGKYNIRHAARAGKTRVYDSAGIDQILGLRREIASYTKRFEPKRNMARWELILSSWLVMKPARNGSKQDG